MKGLSVSGIWPRAVGGMPKSCGADLDDHVLLPADGLAAAHLEQDVLLRHAEPLGGLLGVEQERAVDAAVAEQQRRAAHEGQPVEHGPDDILGDVHDGEGVDAGLDSFQIAHRGQHFGGGVAGAGAEPAHRAVDLGGSGAGGNLGIDLAAKANPDGYTMLMISAAYAFGPSMKRALLASEGLDVVWIEALAQAGVRFVADDATGADVLAERPPGGCV